MTPLVLVHGFMGGSHQWTLQEPLGATRPLIVVDLPGFGRNADLEPINSIGDFAARVLAEVSRRGVERFDLLGHSMGGMIVQEMVRQVPTRVGRLVLYGTGPMGDLPQRFESIETSRQRAVDDGAEATARRISATWFREREAAPEYPGCAAIAARCTLPAILAGLEAMGAWNGEADLRSIASPTLILWGDGDRTYPWSQVEMLWRSIPDSRLAVVPDCAHAVHSENAPLFNLLVEGFLERA